MNETPPLTVAVTGPTGTFGSGLVPLLESDQRIGRVIGIARRPFDPASKGWSKMSYRQGDVRDPAALEAAFDGADVVVHLAFIITGTAPRATIRAINVEGTLNTFRAAAAAGAKRFVYASSVAAYGFHPDNPVPMDEEWPVRPATKLFYAQEKAEIERLLDEEARDQPELELYLLRPPIVLGPNAVGAKQFLPGPLAAIAAALGPVASRVPIPPVPVLAPDHPIQFIHEADVGSAFLQCIVAAGPPGAYNIAADVLTAAEVARTLGLPAISFPGGVMRQAAKTISSAPFMPPAAEWVEALTHPAIMDTAKARRELAWTPRHSSADALRETLGR